MAADCVLAALHHDTESASPEARAGAVILARMALGIDALIQGLAKAAPSKTSP